MAAQTVDWRSELLGFLIGLQGVREQCETGALHSQALALLLRHAHGRGAALLSLVDPATARRLAAVPAPFFDGFDDARWLAEAAAHKGIRQEAGAPGRAERELLVVLPVACPGFAGAIVLACPEALGGDPGFADFLHHAWPGLQEVVRLGRLYAAWEELRVRFNVILETIPQAVVYIDDGGEHAWANPRAVELLGLPVALSTPVAVAAAMKKLRLSAANAEDLLREGNRLFSSPGLGVHGWEWIFGDPVSRVLEVSCIPVAAGPVRGRLWLFSDATFAHQSREQLKNLNLELARKTALGGGGTHSGPSPGLN